MTQLRLGEPAKQEKEKTFTLKIALKDAAGNLTGKTKTITSDESGEIWEFWMRNKGKPKRKKPEKTPKRELPNAAQAQKILEKIYKKKNKEEMDG